MDLWWDSGQCNLYEIYLECFWESFYFQNKRTITVGTIFSFFFWLESFWSKSSHLKAGGSNYEYKTDIKWLYPRIGLPSSKKEQLWFHL